MTCQCQTHHPDPEPRWRHVVSPVSPGIWVTGEPALEGFHRTEATHRRWHQRGAQVVLDLTGHAPDGDLETHRLVIRDDGSVRGDDWFDQLVEFRARRPVVVHCHMGVNRAPSAAYALMLEEGWEPLAALEQLMFARPITVGRYVQEAVLWAGHSRSVADQVEQRRLELVERYRDQLLQAAVLQVP